jgi:hypothetical protein
MVPTPGSARSSLAWMLRDPLGDRCLRFPDGGLQGAQQLHLGGDQLGEHGRGQPGGRDWRCPQPGQQLGRWLAAAVGVAAAERRQADLAEPGGGLRGRIVGQEGQVAKNDDGTARHLRDSGDAPIEQAAKPAASATMAAATRYLTTGTLVGTTTPSRAISQTTPKPANAAAARRSACAAQPPC